MSGGDGSRHEVRAGQAALWEPGEDHESGTNAGMIIEAPARPLSSDP